MEQFFKEHGAALQMRLLSAEANLKRIIREPTVNRPGLALSGFTQYFAYKRVQVFGHAEVYYLRSLTHEQREARYAYLFAYKIPCVVFSRGLKPDKELLCRRRKSGRAGFPNPAGDDDISSTARRWSWKICSRRAARKSAAWWTSSAWA